MNLSKPRRIVRFALLVVGLHAAMTASTVEARNGTPWPAPIAHPTRAEIRIAQDGLQVDRVSKSGELMMTIAGGGLGYIAAFGSRKSMEHAAKSRVEEVREVLEGYDFRGAFERRFREHADLAAVAPQLELSFLQSTVAADQERKALATGRDLLVIEPLLTVSQTFRQVAVSLEVRIVDREADRDGAIDAGHATFHRVYRWAQVLPPPHDTSGKHWLNRSADDPHYADDNAERLAALGRPALEAAITRDIDQVITLLVADLGPAGRKAYAEHDHYDRYLVFGTPVRGEKQDALGLPGEVFRTPYGVLGFEGFGATEKP